jgi:Helix-turn-helix domain
MNNRTLFGTLPHALSTRASDEAALRLAGGDAAFEALLDAPPRFDPHERNAVRHAATAVTQACKEAAHGSPTQPRPKTRQAASGAPGGSLRTPRRLLGHNREKMFGEGRAVPLDREAKCRVVTKARALMHPTEPGKHYGKVTAKTFAVLGKLIWIFHNMKSGRCFPSYKTIARMKPRCSPDTVAEAIVALEGAGLLSWCHRLARRVINGVKKVVRTSNSYWFHDPGSKSEIRSLPPSVDNQEQKERDNDAPGRRDTVSRKQASGSSREERDTS